MDSIPQIIYDLLSTTRLKLILTKVQHTRCLHLHVRLIVHTEIDLQNTFMPFVEAYQLMGLSTNAKIQTRIFPTCATITAPSIDIKKYRAQKTSLILNNWVATSASRQTSTSIIHIIIWQVERPCFRRKRLQNSNQDTGQRGCYP